MTTKKSKKKKAEVKESKKAEKKAPGVIASILEFIQHGPISKKHILSKLQKRFPDRPVEGMEKTINAQLPNRMSKEKGVKIKVDSKGQYYIKKIN